MAPVACSGGGGTQRLKGANKQSPFENEQALIILYSEMAKILNSKCFPLTL
jgi:hypothetical protein